MTVAAKLVVIAGPSAVGKGTLAKFIVENYEGFQLSVSATTREPRPDEQEGRSYFFVSEPDFVQMAETGKLLEWAIVHGKHSYGTPRSAIERGLGLGFNVILEIDVQGAFQVKDRFPGALLIFVEPPSFDELKRRLDRRATESEQDKKVRLETAKIELAQAELFDFVVINDEVARCAQEVVDLVLST